MTTTEVEVEKQKFYFHVAPNIWGLKDVFVNIYMVKDENSNNWVLVDTGLNAAKKIKKMAADIFGEDNAKPKAILAYTWSQRPYWHRKSFGGRMARSCVRSLS